MKKFEQLKRLYNSIINYSDPNDFSDKMVSAITADFDRLFELSWKTIKEYLYTEKMMREAKTGSPKQILKLAFQEGLISDEEAWLDMLRDRNDDTHHYKHSSAILYMSRINDYYMPYIHSFIDIMEQYIPNEDIPSDRIPTGFLTAWKASHMPMDEFALKIKTEQGFGSVDDVFINWEDIKNCYEDGI